MSIFYLLDLTSWTLQYVKWFSQQFVPFLTKVVSVSAQIAITNHNLAMIFGFSIQNVLHITFVGELVSLWD